MVLQVLHQQHVRIKVEDLADVDGLDEGEESLPRFVFTHEGLMRPQLPSKFFLAKPNLDTMVPKDPAQCLFV